MACAIEPNSIEPVRISRGPDARRITAYCFQDFARLAQDAGVDALGPQCLFSDLSCGPWRGHWLARDLCAQLDLCEPQPIQPSLHDAYQAGDAYADTVSQLIDAESRGDGNFTAAYALACRITERIRADTISHVFVVAPQGEHVWGTENLHLLKLLSDAARCYGFQLWCISRGDCALSPVAGIEWAPFNAPLAQTQPEEGSPLAGLVLPAWVAAVNPKLPCLRVRDGRVLISPNARRGRISAAQRRRLSALVLPDHLRAYLALSAPVQDVQFLQASAGRCFAEGGYDAAMALLDGIDTRALDALRCAVVEAQKQRISIALMRFERAAAGMLPNDAMPDDVKASLYQSKAWGLVMTGRAGEANRYFDLARAHFDSDSAPRLAMYLLNISALAKLKSNDIDGAVLLEKQIEARLQDPVRRDWHLLYINALNLARIYKKIGDFARCARYYHFAFSVMSGVRTDSDLLYMNLCHAQLETLSGNADAAFHHWLRTATHWLSNPLPEALAPRVAQAILGKPLNDSEADVEAISATLDKALREAASERGVTFSAAEKVVAFGRLTEPGQADMCVLGEGLTVALSSQAVVMPPFAGPKYDALKQTVTGILMATFHAIDFSHVRSVLSDSRHGIEMPLNLREALWSCCRYDIRVLTHAARQYRLATEDDDVLAKFVVRLGAGIGAISRGDECLRIHFKRYVPPIEVDARERDIVEGLARPLSLAQLAERLGRSIRACAKDVRSLEDRHVVMVD
ncbi:hypothetical protein PCO31111_00498 [Pandoraea communis]|uniref:Tetratricopeptide repeat protein n=1 Tax=Pandoraea communis TaxID=2508297 RepID=A0A5E4RYN4_9BURK|nr:Lrp/AsnC family transcriptional regulator [Pandoraea communis]VVD68630.1 hypothetical protein PCO31111_00498 [Pandoraea communis]